MFSGVLAALYFLGTWCFVDYKPLYDGLLLNITRDFGIGAWVQYIMECDIWSKRKKINQQISAKLKKKTKQK